MYRETHSADLMGEYQARRLGVRVRRDSGEKEFVHMNDATVFALGRILIAIIENNQQADGTVLVPEVLRPYMGGLRRYNRGRVRRRTTKRRVQRWFGRRTRP